MSEKEMKLQVVLGLAEIFNKELSKAELSIYLSVLEEMEALELKITAIEGLRQNAWKFMPKPGELLHFGQSPKDVTDRLDAKDQFSHLLRLASGNKPFEEITEKSWKALRLSGGLSALKNCCDDDLVWFEKRFFENYIDCCDVEIAEDRKLKLESTKRLNPKMKEVLTMIGKNV